jgi:hypothetical protein
MTWDHPDLKIPDCVVAKVAFLMLEADHWFQLCKDHGLVEV